MSKFKRVVDTEGLGEVANSAFGVQAAATDPYAHLRESAADNQIKMAKQQMGGGREAAAKPHDWETVPEQQNYVERRTLTIEERLAQLNPADFAPNAVRRSDYGIDAGDTAREVTSGLKAYSPEDYMNVMLRGSASIFDPDMAVIADEFEKSQEETSQQAIARANQIRMARKTKHDDWESDKTAEIATIRKPSVLTHRASSVLRTAIENEAAGNFGMMDYDQLEKNEAQRIAMAEAQRETRLALKSKHTKDRSQRHQEWEEGALGGAKTANDIYRFIDLDIDKE